MIIAVTVTSCKKETEVAPVEKQNVLKIELTNVDYGVNVRTTDEKVYLLSKIALNLQVENEGTFAFYTLQLTGNEGVINCNVYFKGQKLNFNLLKKRTNVIHYSENSLWIEK